MQKPELNVVMCKVSELLPYGKNAKKHPDRQIVALADLIKKVGFRFPISIDEDRTIIAGHGRLLAAQRVGMKSVPCIVQTGLTETEKKALRLADNRLAEIAETDPVRLLEELESLRTDEFELGMVGYSTDEVSEMVETSKLSESLEILGDGREKSGKSTWSALSESNDRVRCVVGDLEFSVSPQCAKSFAEVAKKFSTTGTMREGAEIWLLAKLSE